MRRIGVLISFAESDPQAQNYIVALREGLAALGWIEGRNLRIDVRFAPGDLARLRAQPKELVRLTPDAVVAHGSAGLVAARDATRTIPIVFVLVQDPIGQGYVSSLSHPGANITGFAMFEPAMSGKLVQFLHALRQASLGSHSSGAQGAGRPRSSPFPRRSQRGHSAWR